jgi:hypothetical protein
MSVSKTVSDFVKGLLGDPEALGAVRDALAALPAPPPPGRPEMAAEERRALGAEQDSRSAAFVQDRAARARKREAAWAQIREGQEQAERVGAEEREAGDAYSRWRDGVQARLWNERPPLVDLLVERCGKEAAGLRVEIVEAQPPKGLAGASLLSPRPGMGEIVDGDAIRRNDAALHGSYRDNRVSVEARARGLRALAEELREATCKGRYGTAQELERLFASLYAALPQVERPNSKAAQRAPQPAA